MSRAEVRVDGKVVGSMGEGLLALVGVARGDSPEDVRFLVEKLVHLRIFPDDDGRMNRSVLDVSGSFGAVSQFTLLGDCRKGRRPSYADAAPPEEAEALFRLFVEAVEKLGVPVVTGQFRAYMQVDLVNEGPVTVLLDSRRAF